MNILSRLFFLLITGFLLLVFGTACHSTDQAQKPDSVRIEFVSPEKPDTTGSEEYYVIEQTQPELIGGIQRLQNKLRYPKEAQDRNITGVVQLGFMVTKDGKIEDITVIQSPHPLLSRAAKRALKKMRFIPGVQDGKPVDVYMALPIYFSSR